MRSQPSIRKAVSLVFVFVLLFASFGPAAGRADRPGQDGAAAIHLKVGSFVPSAGERPALPPGLSIAGYTPGQSGYYIVQFRGPIMQSWKDQLATAGGEILDYIPDFAFKVRMNPAEAARAAALDSVAWVGLFQPGYKLSPSLKLDGVNLYRVRVERGANAGLATAAVATSGAKVLARDANLLLVAADAAQVEAIVNVTDVAWIENFQMKEKHNEYGAGVIMGSNIANANGYDGSSQIAAVADTGLGGGTAATAHPDLPASRIVAIQNFPGADSGGCYTVIDDGAQDVDSGHGTHVTLSVAGDGGANGEGKGTAPAASIVFQAVENYIDFTGLCSLYYADGYYLMGLPDDLHTLFQNAYNAGARIHSNSWGSAAAGDYTLDSANTDDFIWNNPDMTITFSAGNEGVDANNNGVVDSDSIGSPATAKNVITVGASENQRADGYPCDTSLSYTSHDAYQSGQTCSSMGGNNFLGTAGQRWGFTTEPLNSDPTAGNAEQMAPFSSRGPTDDGRIKPDVVAPGTWILSGYSDMYQEGYGDPTNPVNGVYQVDGWGMPYNSSYKYFGGTSMSNPLTAGAATVIRDFYQKAYNHSASAALVKATLINSAIDLLDENNDGVNDNDFPIPNVHEGWGRVNLTNATDGSHVFYDVSGGLSTNGSDTYAFSVNSGATFKVSLAWSDFASTDTAAINLVNDLDLIVTAPDGTVYRGNNFSGGWTQSGGSADRINNVENVYIQSAAAGTWTVEVRGYNVPSGPQPYAVVVDGTSSQPVDTAPSVSITSPADGSTVASTVAVQIAASDAQDAAGTLLVEWNVDGGAWQTAAYNSASGSYEASWDTSTVSDGSHTINARATDSGSNQAFDSNTVTVSNAPPATMHIGDLDGSTVSVRRNRYNATITITVHDGADQALSGASVSGSWSSGDSASCTTGSNGTCQVSLNDIRSKNISFSVNNVSHSGYTYTSAANHDPDGDSDGTTITLTRP